MSCGMYMSCWTPKMMAFPMPESPFPVGYFQVLIVSLRECLIFSVRIQTVEIKMQVGKVNRVTVSPVEQCAKPWEFRYTVPPNQRFWYLQVYMNPCQILVILTYNKGARENPQGFETWTLLICWGLVVFQRCMMPHVGQMYVPPCAPWLRRQGRYWYYWWCGKPRVSLNEVWNIM